ncbi:hypothetical protein GW17_00013524, partial [Ensete ventricosum]
RLEVTGADMGGEEKSRRRRRHSRSPSPSPSAQDEEETSRKRRKRDGREKKSRKDESRTKERKKEKKRDESPKHSKSRDGKGWEKKSKEKHKRRRMETDSFEELSKDDYFAKNNEFATWLKKEKGIYFSELSSDAARELFSGFVKEWNSGKLQPVYYEGIASGPRTAHNWRIKHEK